MNCRTKGMGLSRASPLQSLKCVFCFFREYSPKASGSLLHIKGFFLLWQPTPFTNTPNSETDRTNFLIKRKLPRYVSITFKAKWRSFRINGSPKTMVLLLDFQEHFTVKRVLWSVITQFGTVLNIKQHTSLCSAPFTDRQLSIWYGLKTRPHPPQFCVGALWSFFEERIAPLPPVI